MCDSLCGVYSLRFGDYSLEGETFYIVLFCECHYLHCSYHCYAYCDFPYDYIIGCRSAAERCLWCLHKPVPMAMLLPSYCDGGRPLCFRCENVATTVAYQYIRTLVHTRFLSCIHHTHPRPHVHIHTYMTLLRMPTPALRIRRQRRLPISCCGWRSGRAINT